MLEDGEWVYGGKIEDYIREVAGNKASNASRRCRELAKEGRLEKRLVKLDRLQVVQYRKKPIEIPRSAYHPAQTALFV